MSKKTFIKKFKQINMSICEFFSLYIILALFYKPDLTENLIMWHPSCGYRLKLIKTRAFLQALCLDIGECSNFK